ncbi:MAG TPA: hypothetical protein VMJ10_07770 [Kofleriaceae bacterium]|nr:hypothetical protein [Kofleriaceae bacterium]
MRTTKLAVVCSLLAPACVNVPHADYNFGADAGSGSAATCSDPELVIQDLEVNGSAAPDGTPSGCWTLQGKLTVTGSGVTTLANLGQLQSVNELEVANTALTSFDTPLAIQVSGAVYIHDNAQLAAIDKVTPATSRIDSLRVENNAALTAVGTGLVAVQSVTNQTTFLNNGKLATIDLHQAQRLEGGLDIENDGALTSIEIDALNSTADLTLKNNAVLTSISLGALQFIHGSLTIDTNAKLDLGTAMTSTITAIDYNLAITNNAALTGIGNLDHAGGVIGTVNVSNNAQLDYCQARSIGCCVPHPGTAEIQNDGNNQCNSGHSWCYSNGQCPYAY